MNSPAMVRVFRPDEATGPLPTVMAAGGWCYTKEIVLPHVARIIKVSEAPLHEHWSTTESAELLNTKVMMIVAEGDNITAWERGEPQWRMSASGVNSSVQHTVSLRCFLAEER